MKRVISVDNKSNKLHKLYKIIRKNKILNNKKL